MGALWLRGHIMCTAHSTSPANVCVLAAAVPTSTWGEDNTTYGTCHMACTSTCRAFQRQHPPAVFAQRRPVLLLHALLQPLTLCHDS